VAFTEFAGTALGLAEVFVVGRAILTWLPPGAVGSHRPRELAVTWAASHVLGCAAIAAAAGFAALLGRSAPPAVLVVAALTALGLRWLSLPAALRPRHEIARETPGNLATLALFAALSLALATCWLVAMPRDEGMWAVRAQAWLSQGWLPGFGPQGSRDGALALAPMVAGSLALIASPLGTVSEFAARAQLGCFFVATLLLSEHALATARRAPLWRRLLVLALAAALVPAASPDPDDLALASLCALCLSGMCAWTRRADARGLALACIGLAAMPMARPAGWLLALAGFFALLATSARPSRVRASIGAVCAVFVLALPWPLAALLRHVPLLGDDPLAALASDWALNTRAELFWWLAPLWIALGACLGPAFLQLFRRPLPERMGLHADDADRTRRDLAAFTIFAAALALSSIGLALTLDVSLLLLARTWAPGCLVFAAPLACALAGRALLPADSPA
jgi:hypothetical protein